MSSGTRRSPAGKVAAMTAAAVGASLPDWFGTLYVLTLYALLLSTCTAMPYPAPEDIPLDSEEDTFLQDYLGQTDDDKRQVNFKHLTH